LFSCNCVFYQLKIPVKSYVYTKQPLFVNYCWLLWKVTTVTNNTRYSFSSFTRDEHVCRAAKGGYIEQFECIKTLFIFISGHILLVLDLHFKKNWFLIMYQSFRKTLYNSNYSVFAMRISLIDNNRQSYYITFIHV
jgi:hypothetical protein